MRIRKQAPGDDTMAPRGWRGLGLTTRLLMSHAVVLTVAMGLILLLAYLAVARQQLTSAQTDMLEELPEYSQSASHRPAGEGLAAFTAIYVATHPRPSGLTLVIGLGGTQAASVPAGNALASAPEVRAWVITPPARSTIVDVATPAITYNVVASPIVLGGRAVGVLIAGIDLDRVQRQALSLLPAIGAEAGAALIIALVAAYVLLRRVRRTVARITETAATITRDDLSQRLDYRGPDDDLGQLARTFDVMLERVEAAFVSQRDLISNVSHQLRTPLTVMRGHLDVLLRSGAHDRTETVETLSLVIDEIDHTNALVDELLMLGRSLEPDFIEREPVDLRSFLADLFSSAQALAPRRWILEPVPDALVNIDRAKMRGALLNLLDNAVHATRPDDSITLRASCDGALVLSVADTGKGIPAADHEAVFQRFVHTPGDHPGSGLGLTIVRAIAEAHGGHASLQSAPGAGCTVSIELPATCIESVAAAHLDLGAG
ncbi:MAG TPA: HAMP domain-containing sensor histidine kinase [Candidatus Saccharimonadales bacterium]|nr:HAMP domain-containing sensor histidine kinase [Candidatus Saccharimonadales bacterium]